MATKLLLIKDVENLGRSGDVVSVKPGYARNFIMPRGFGIIADKSALRKQVRLKEERLKQAILDKQEAEKTAASIEGVTVSTIVKVDQEGHMYGSVSAHDIADLLSDQAKIILEKRSIVLKHPIKQTGVYPVTVKLKEGVTASITVKVMSEAEQDLAADQPAATQP
jgi:large subunit ribosomal protein L9